MKKHVLRFPCCNKGMLKKVNMVNRRMIIFSLFLLASTAHGFAQQGCNLQLVPEGNNPCILDMNYDFSVIRACRGNTVNYRAYSPSAINYEWTVVGGDYQLAENGTVCQVTWGNGFNGTVIVEALQPDSSVCTSQLRIDLSDKPTAGVISIPNYIVDVSDPQKKWIEVCAGDTLSFVDNSTSADNPITDYYWEFPYGSSTSRSISFVARDPGDFKVVHRVYNECGCYDEVIIEIIVKEKCPMKLSCFGTVCAYSEQFYSLLSPVCSDYLWNVQGGTIVSPQHNPDVVVQWDAPESGFGTLYLDGTGCDCECKSRKSIRIPVISGNVNINGPDILCNGEQYVFSVPLWGATQYSWTVTPSTGIGIWENHNKLTLMPYQAGTFTVSVTYACDFLGCGPYTVSKTINVRSPLTISSTPSAEEVCIGTALSFSTNTSSASQWTVKLNDSILRTANAPTLVHTFDTSGIFVVQAKNASYCEEATMIVHVKGEPSVPSLISGPDTICPLYTAEYSATPSSQDNYILWEWTANGTTCTCSGNQANITFGGTVNDINVYQVSRSTGCRSEAAVYHVSPFQLAEWPYTDTIRVCQGQTITLSSLRDQSDQDVLYEWEVHPANVLSIQGSHLTAGITLTANYTNNLPAMAKAILKRVYCGTYQYDTAYVRIGEIDAPTITHGLVCAGQNTSFSVPDPAEADRDSTYWYIDNYTGSRKFGPTAQFVINDTDTHIVHLHYVSKFGCEADTYDTVVPCPPLPDMHVDTGNNMLSVVIDGDTTGYSYLWMTGETTSGIVASPDSFWCVVTSPDCGCFLKLSHDQDNPDIECTNVNSAFEIARHCNNIISIVNLNGPGLDYPVGVTISQHNHSRHFTVTDPEQTIMVPDVGVYTVKISWSQGDTCYYSLLSDSITQAVQMQITKDCYGHMLINGNQVNGGAIPINVSVSETQSNTIVGSDSGLGHVSISMPNSGWYQVHTVFGNSDCYIDTLVHFDAAPTIQSINVGSMMCEKTSFTFSANATGAGLTYRWDFGDGSWNFGNGIGHVYDHLESYNINLTVTDRNGCSANATTSVSIVNNPLVNESQYRIQNTFNPICSGDSAVLQTYPGNNLYSWYPCSQFTGNIANVYEAGTYMVDITTIQGQCRKQYATNVPYPNGPFAAILANSSYCRNDVAEFKGDVGSEYNYRWYIHNSHFSDSATSANFAYRLIDTGYHQVILRVSDTNGCSAYDTAEFYVYPIPPAPALQFCGNPCITEGPVEICSTNGMDLLWSNGTKGSSALFFTDGPVGAYYIDTATGCQSSGTRILIPEAPDFDGLLTGCYCIDEKYLPVDLSLFTLSSIYSLPWKWRLFNSTISSGTLPPNPASLIIPSEGEYRLLVTDYGLGCTAESPTLTIEKQGCKSSVHPNNSHSVWGIVKKKECEQIGCDLEYNIVVKICNGTGEPVCIDGLYPSPTVSYSVISGLPMTLNPGECRDVTFRMVYDFSSPSSFIFSLRCGGEYVGAFVVDLSDWMECVRPDSCRVVATGSFVLDRTLSHPNQSAFFNFALSFPLLSCNVISVWSDQGQVIDGNNSGSSYSGLLMLDYGLMTQMVVDSADFCFHFICCIDDNLCISDYCIPFWKLWEICEQLGTRGGTRMVNYSGGNLSIGEGEKTFLLVPNPATDIVSVERKRNNPASGDILLIEVFSMNGQKVLSQESSNQFDVSRLADGSYIVKVVTSNNDYEYLKLIKQ